MYAGFFANFKVHQFQLVHDIDRPRLAGPPRVQERILAKTPGQMPAELHDPLPIRAGIWYATRRYSDATQTG